MKPHFSNGGAGRGAATRLAHEPAEAFEPWDLVRRLACDETPAWPRGVDDDELWKFLTRHRLRNLAARWAESDPLRLPKRFAKRLARHQAEQAAHHERLRNALGEALDHFTQDRIDVILLKGFVLADQCYARPAERYQRDLDVLVRLQDVPRAAETLFRLGYVLRGGRTTIRPTKLHTEHAVSFYRGEVQVDLHWSLRQAPKYRLQEPTLWETSRAISWSNRPCRTLSLDYQLTLLLLSTAHDLARGACRGKHLLDLFLLLRTVASELDPDEFAIERALDGTRSVIVNMLAVVLAAFDCRQELPWAAAVLDSHAGRIGVGGPSEARKLLASEPDDLDNLAWFLAAYRGIGLRDIAWYVRRSVPHAGRIPVAIFRSVRFAFRWLQWTMSRRR